jgi:hypothetical protein
MLKRIIILKSRHNRHCFHPPKLFMAARTWQEWATMLAMTYLTIAIFTSTFLYSLCHTFYTDTLPNFLNYTRQQWLHIRNILQSRFNLSNIPFLSPAVQRMYKSASNYFAKSKLLSLIRSWSTMVFLSSNHDRWRRGVVEMMYSVAAMCIVCCMVIARCIALVASQMMLFFKRPTTATTNPSTDSSQTETKQNSTDRGKSKEEKDGKVEEDHRTSFPGTRMEEAFDRVTYYASWFSRPVQMGHQAYPNVSTFPVRGRDAARASPTKRSAPKPAGISVLKKFLQNLSRSLISSV